METNKTIVTTHDLSIGYTDKKILVQSINLSLQSGALVCLLGPNGAGKSTLIRTLSGIQKPLSGQVLIEGEDIHHIHPKTKAQLLSVVLTEPVVVGNLSVQRLIELGRHPYTNWLGLLGAQDQ
jgi:iron complex transport system ATP-binding protein